jgi:hypothetical protein
MSPVKNFEQVVAAQATKLAAFARPRHQFDASIAGVAFGAADIGLSHGRTTTIPRHRVLSTGEIVKGY